jgi:hypothetical protein
VCLLICGQIGDHRHNLVISPFHRIAWVECVVIMIIILTIIYNVGQSEVNLKATSHTRLKALDHGNVRALIGRKGGDRSSSLHTRR